MRGNLLWLSILICTLISSCSTGTPPATPVLVPVYSTLAAQPWLSGLYKCAGTTTALLRIDDPSMAEIVLRLGEPELLDTPAYQIDTEELLIVAHRRSSVQNLSLEQARALFSGFGDPSVQVWVYADGEDVQDIFDRAVMAEDSVVSTARLAVDPQHMSDTLVDQPNTVGILPRRWKVGDVREVFSVATVPVLAITRGEPQGVIRELIACLQK
ncbi:MAG TPA: hypothetical protein VFY26_15560 [Anaerolineales bacterium]|nr:hypothetical protein [Anaerolineales bacterium]